MEKNQKPTSLYETAWFAGLMKNRPVQPIYSGPIAQTVFELNRTSVGSGSVFYRSDRRSSPVQITRVGVRLGASTPGSRAHGQVISTLLYFNRHLSTDHDKPLMLSRRLYSSISALGHRNGRARRTVWPDVEDRLR